MLVVVVVTLCQFVGGFVTFALLGCCGLMI